MAVEVSTVDGGRTGSIRAAQWKGSSWGPVRWRKDNAPLCAGPAGFQSKGPSELVATDLGTVSNALRDFSATAPPEYFDSQSYPLATKGYLAKNQPA
eukprot:scaffold33392_cov55-Prasinocladus_malaysianus.AAC.2